jgi:hypothetical protein
MLRMLDMRPEARAGIVAPVPPVSLIIEEVTEPGILNMASSVISSF